MTTPFPKRIVAVALNPAIDRVLEVPGLTVGGHQVARRLTRYPGGKAVNLARALSLLEVPCILTGLVGRDDLDYFAHDLVRSHVRMAMLPVAGPTRENITLVDPVNRNETHLREQGFTVLAEERNLLRQRLAELAARDVLFVFSGSLPPGIFPADLSDLLVACRQAGGQLAVDASGEALATAVGAEPWLIKPNQAELEELLGHGLHSTEELLTAGRAMAGRMEQVLVSRGAEGAYLFTGNEAYHARCGVPRERLASTVGCGDTLLAGYLAGLQQELNPAGALQLAVAVAAACAMSLTPQFDRKQVDHLLEQAEVEKV